jgi:hypothetical protein
MNKKFWWKAAFLLTAGSLFQLTNVNGCAEAIIQRVIIAAMFD